MVKRLIARNSEVLYGQARKEIIVFFLQVYAIDRTTTQLAHTDHKVQVPVWKPRLCFNSLTLHLFDDVLEPWACKDIIHWEVQCGGTLKILAINFCVMEIYVLLAS